ncbi:sulfate permease [Microbacterium lacticum]|uniref:sulfate permease n=1 Tax=Microbacterium lacticum TaxID=33885 RepID=UPI0018B04DFE|nr:sulfate permease [Microbacterium lacticum]MBF9335986.1 sulfate permease [Microbacterium lacticum]
MFRLIWTPSVRTRDYLHRYMPSNRLLAAIRTRRELKWGMPAMLVALPYLLIARISSGAAADGGPGWLHLIVLWACWNALKFIIMGPASVVLLLRVRLREASIRRHQRHDSRVEASLREPALAIRLNRPRQQMP